MAYDSFDVVVVGAGIAGTMMANLLAKKTDLSIGVIDVNQPTPSWSAETIAPRVSAINHAATMVFRYLGLWETLKAKRVSPYTHMRVWDDSSIGKIEFDCADVNQPYLGHIVENNLMNSAFSVEDLANELNFSRMQLYRKLKTVRGLSANDFIRAYRIKKAALLLRETDLNVSEILYRIGFTNRSYFSKCFKKTFDISPKAYAVKYREEKRKSEED